MIQKNSKQKRGNTDKDSKSAEQGEIRCSSL